MARRITSINKLVYYALFFSRLGFLQVALHFLMQFGFLWGRKSKLGNSPKDKRSEELIQIKSIMLSGLTNIILVEW